MLTDPVRQRSRLRGRRRDWLVAAAFLVVFLATRLTVADRLPYFLDEGLFAGYSYRGAHSAGQLFVSLSIGKEPLQAWLGIVWQALGANPLMSMRLVSVAAGLLSVVSVAWLGALVGGRGVAIVAALLYVLLPFFLVNDAVGIEEPLVTLVMATALALQISLARRPGVGRALALAAVLAAGILTKQSCEAAVALLPLSLLCVDFSAAGRARRLGIWLAIAALGVAAAVAAGLVLRASGYWARGVAFMHFAPLVRPLSAVLDHPLATAGHAWSVFSPALSGYVTWPLIAAGVGGAAVAARRDLRLTLLLAGWVIIPFGAALIFTLVPYPRHVMFALPPALVLVAVGAAAGAGELRRRVDGRAAVVLAAAAGCVVLALALVDDARYLAHPRTARYPGLDDLQYVTGVPAGGAWPEVAQAIRSRSGPGRSIVLAAQADPNVIGFLLSADPAAPGNRWPVVLPSSPRAGQAEFAIVDQLPFGNPAALHRLAQEHFIVVGRYPRPRAGAVVTLYERPR